MMSEVMNRFRKCFGKISNVLTVNISRVLKLKQIYCTKYIVLAGLGASDGCASHCDQEVAGSTPPAESATFFRVD